MSGEQVDMGFQRFAENHAFVANFILAHFTVVRGTAHFQHGKAAPHFTVKLHIAQQDNSVGQSGEVNLRQGFAAFQCRTKLL